MTLRFNTTADYTRSSVAATDRLLCAQLPRLKCVGRVLPGGYGVSWLEATTHSLPAQVIASSAPSGGAGGMGWCASNRQWREVDVTVAVRLSVNVGLWYDMKRLHRSTGVQAAIVRPSCVFYSGTTSSTGTNIVLPPVFAIPPRLAIPDDARLTIERRSAVVRGGDDTASLRLMTSGGQNVSLIWHAGSGETNTTNTASTISGLDLVPISKSGITDHFLADNQPSGRALTDNVPSTSTSASVEDGSNTLIKDGPTATLGLASLQMQSIAQFTSPGEHSMVVQLPRMFDLWNGSCDAGVLPIPQDRRARISFKYTGHTLTSGDVTLAKYGACTSY